MVRTFFRAAGTLATTLLLCSSTIAQQKVAYDLLPDNTQAVVWVRNGDELLERWDRTQLSQLLSDESVAPFFNAQRADIEQRLMDAGWRLNVKPKDLSEYAEGQIAFAWAGKKDTPLKPFAIALIADVADDAKINDRMMAEIEQQLDPQKAKRKTLSHNGVTITSYSLPPRPGELIEQNSFFAIIDGLLLASDDEQFVNELIDRYQGKPSSRALSKEEVFVRGRELAGITGNGQVEYFARPLGFARVLRSIGGKRSKSSADMLAVLENQGFDAIRCVCGELILGQPDLDIHHRGYAYAKLPLPKAAQVLDFPNNVARDIPNFVGENIASLLATNWNAKEAFWHTKGLVDEIAGTEGVFDEVIEGIKKDPNGPRIDIRNEVLPNFTNDIYSITDSREGDASIDSRRNLIALKLKDSGAMAKVLNKAMKGEPDAELVEFEGQEIWKVVHREDENVAAGGLDDFSDFEAPAPVAQDGGNQPQPWLNNWAITVHEDYLMFASHVEMIEDAIRQAEKSDISPLANSRDYQRVMGAIAQYYGNEDACAWQIMRTDKAYRVQYELFRKGELRKSESMLASILDRLLQSEDEIRSKDQKIKGEGLPDFSELTKYLQPSGMMIRATADGWEFGSMLLSNTYEPSTELSSASQLGTARVSNSETGANR